MATLRLKPPYRAEHIGSLLRPAELLEKRGKFEAKVISAEELRVAEEAAIKYAVKLQKDLGINTITDGEYTRGLFFEGVFENLEGMTALPNRPMSEFKPYIPHIAMMSAWGLTESESVFCSGKIKRSQPFYTEQFKFLRSVVAPDDVKNIKITMCSPSWMHQRHGSDLTYDLSVYKNDKEYFDDLGVAYREEIQELYALGCRHIQIDDPTFCYFCDDRMIEGMEKAGVDHEALLDSYIRSINICVEGRPSDLTVGVHTCRGNYKGGVHFSEGGYGRIAAKLFNTLDVDTFYLEYDTERSGDFEPLKHLPLTKVAVLGLVTTKNTKLPTVEELKVKVHEAAETMSQGSPSRSKAEALNQLCISTQCGFASVWEGNPITEDDEKKKLALLVEASKQIWPDQ